MTRIDPSHNLAVFLRFLTKWSKVVTQKENGSAAKN